MKKKDASTESTRRTSNTAVDTQPLIAALLATASRRGHKLTELARELGVTYERLAQWRRRPEDVASAGDSVYEHAARYLGLPAVLTMVLGGKIGLEHFVWPEAATLVDRLHREMSLIRQDRFIGGFAPRELTEASPPVQLFIAFLYAQLQTSEVSQGMGLPWIRALHQTVAGDVVLQDGLQKFSGQEVNRDRIF